MPRRFGDMRIDEAFSYKEVWGRTESLPTLPQNLTTTFSVGSFTMPWAGQAVADMTVMVGWTGYQHVQASLSSSSPAPTNYTTLIRLGDDLSATYTEIPLLARWPSLVANQTVTLYVAAFCGGGGSNATAYRCAGSVRMMPS